MLLVCGVVSDGVAACQPCHKGHRAGPDRRSKKFASQAYLYISLIFVTTFDERGRICARKLTLILTASLDDLRSIYGCQNNNDTIGFLLGWAVPPRDYCLTPNMQPLSIVSTHHLQCG
jgi:hypothetical protein